MPYDVTSGFEGLFMIVSILISGIFILVLANSFRQWNKNNHSPHLIVDATIVSKRIDVTHHRHTNAGDMTGAHGYHTTTSSTYYVTFQVETGDCIELCVDESVYDMFLEGDKGKLTFQGTRYLEFERKYK